MKYSHQELGCHESNLGGHYDGCHVVVLNGYDHNTINDWNNIVDENSDTFVETSVPNLKPHVVEWLNSNISPIENSVETKGWAIDSVDVRINNGMELNVYFHRQTDAIKFIRALKPLWKPMHHLVKYKKNSDGVYSDVPITVISSEYLTAIQDYITVIEMAIKGNGNDVVLITNGGISEKDSILVSDLNDYKFDILTLTDL